jgi:hypothetical protein
MSDDKTITFYRIYENESEVRLNRSPRTRDWMENTSDKYAYRCLPLTIANQHGWCVYLNREVTVVWNGHRNKHGIEVMDGTQQVGSYFGEGIVTFHVNHIVRTPPEYNLYISGAPNFFKDNVQALTGIYESSWAAQSFTMNWKIMTPNIPVTFGLEDPICFFFPVPRKLVEEFNVDVKHISSDPELHRQHDLFCKSREDHANRLESGELPYGDWQKHYFQGKYTDGKTCPFFHQTKINLKEPKINS